MPRRGPHERGLGGLPPARSALTLRLILATFGLVVSLVGVVASILVSTPYGVVIFFAVLALIAAVDLVVVGTRKRHGEPG
jgi:predicted membrane metal-binding protein